MPSPIKHNCGEQTTDTSPPARLELAFPKRLRLLSKTDFSCVFDDAPVRAAHPSILILARPNRLDHPRLGLVVAKKHARRAVDRNRFKRMARECFRQQQHKLPAIDAIVLARRGAGALSHSDLIKIFNGLWKRINQRANSSKEA